MNLPPLPEPVAHALLKPDGLIDPALVGSKADCEFWSRAEGESQSGWPVVSIHTSDQMRAYGEACAAAGRERWSLLVSDLLSALEYHQEQTRPIHSTRVAIDAARAAIRARGET